MSQILGILVGGGPAPGINGVISSATIEAINSGMKVLGIFDGFKWLMSGETGMNSNRELTIQAVSRIHFTGGSILRTSRSNPSATEGGIAAVINTLKKLGITHLITIGGDDTATSAVAVSKATDGLIKVVHVPKTIDNDLPLASGSSTFGFQSARHFGTFIVQNLMEDSRTTNRWYLVVTMGRSVGFLALGICFASGATLAVIPEEFGGGKVKFSHLCDVVEGAMIKRQTMGRDDGVIVMAEALAEKVDFDERAAIGKIERDEFGHVRLAELDIGNAVKNEIQRRFKARGKKVTMVSKLVGYELRSCPPIPFDIDYTRRLGYGAVRQLLDGEDRVLICYAGGQMQPLKFDDIFDPATGRVRNRCVDIRSEYYKVACDYMIRLTKEDFADPATVTALAKTGGMTPDEFTARYGYLVSEKG